MFVYENIETIENKLNWLEYFLDDHGQVNYFCIGQKSNMATSVKMY